ncbi:phage tail-collar fiber domain-containing protein [Roseobacteraceae bacterium NS-SX3]
MSATLLTNTGRAKEAAALANGTALKITHIAWGDGDRIPAGGEAALLNETGRKPVQGAETDPNDNAVASFKILLAEAEGPYTIREAGLFDEDGDLIAVARYDPPVNKPKDEVSVVLQMNVAFSDLENLILRIEPTDAFVPASRKVATGTGLKGGGDLSQDRTLSLDFSTVSEAKAASIDHKALSPKTGGSLFDNLFTADGVLAKLLQADGDGDSPFLRYRGLVDLEVSADTLTDPGIYRLHENHPGVPADMNYPTLVTLYSGYGQTGIQLLFPTFNHGTVMWRHGNPAPWSDGGWNTWRKIWQEGDQGAGCGSDADKLDGQEGAFYRNAGNLNAGTLPVARLGLATSAQALSGTANDRVMTPLRVKEAISKHIDALLNSAPVAMDTLKELSDAIGDNEDEIAALVAMVGQKLDASEADSFLRSKGFVGAETTVGSIVEPGVYRLAQDHPGTPGNVEYETLVVLYAGYGQVATQLLFPNQHNNSIYWRRGNPPPLGTGSWSEWAEIWHSGMPNLAATMLALLDGAKIASGGAWIENDEIVWENGVNRITHNDGGGNVQIRFGHKEDSGLKFTHDGTAFFIGGPLDEVNGDLKIKVAKNGGAGTGQAVEWGAEFSVSKDGVFLDGVPLAAPIGSEISWTGSTPPPGYLEEDRSTLSRAAYPELWAHAQASGMMDGTGSDTGKFGPGDGASTFQLPDARGEGVRGWDHGRGADAGRTLGSWQAGRAGHFYVTNTTLNAGSGGTPSTDWMTFTGENGAVTVNDNNTVNVQPYGADVAMRNVSRMICIRAY